MKTFIIAEAGVNHNGSLSLAKELVDIASDAAVDAVKFQTFKPSALSTASADMAEYQKTNTGQDDSQLNMLKKLALSENDHWKLLEYCKAKDIQFCSSPFDLESIDFLKKLNMPFWKIPSGEITNLPYLKKIATLNSPVILSTGMSSLSEIEFAMEILTSSGLERDDITLLHCNTDYPTKAEDVNLNCINTLRKAFSVTVGYSDHTTGITFAIAAVSMGAAVIEKHITLDKSMEGPDHLASLDPSELKEMVKAIREIETGLGSPIKRPTSSELKNRVVARKSIVAAVDIRKGSVFSEQNLTVKRPGTGVSPILWDTIVGTIAKRDFHKDECIEIY